jgi:hypothetical protein
MSGPVLSVLLLTIVHIVGMVFLYALMGREMLDMFRMRPDNGDDDGGEPPEPDPAVKPTPSGGGLPLPDAEQASVRLREAGRLAEKYPRPVRRPEHEPQRAPQRDPA